MKYDSSDNFKGMYAPRTDEFIQEGRAVGARPASRDTQKVALILVDVQYDFVAPDGNLSVPGAPEDLQRTVEFIYRNTECISSIFASLDTHNQYQIFYPSWWVYDDNGQHPDAWTMISLNTKGEAVDMAGRRVRPVIDPLWTLRDYLPTLKANAAKDLMLWPYHCMEGSQGRNIMPSLFEALTYYSAARLSQVNYITKGTCPRTEHFGIWGAEVPDPRDPSTSINAAILDVLGQHDLVYVAGQAKSHCVLETMRQTLNYFRNQPEVIRKLRFLDDCTSSVVAPGIDFDALANEELRKMEKSGIVRVKSTDPIG